MLEHRAEKHEFIPTGQIPAHTGRSRALAAVTRCPEGSLQGGRGDQAGLLFSRTRQRERAGCNPTESGPPSLPTETIPQPQEQRKSLPSRTSLRQSRHPYLPKGWLPLAGHKAGPGPQVSALPGNLPLPGPTL